MATAEGQVEFDVEIGVTVATPRGYKDLLSEGDMLRNQFAAGGCVVTNLTAAPLPPMRAKLRAREWGSTPKISGSGSSSGVPWTWAADGYPVPELASKQSFTVKFGFHPVVVGAFEIEVALSWEDPDQKGSIFIRGHRHGRGSRPYSQYRYCVDRDIIELRRDIQRLGRQMRKG